MKLNFFLALALSACGFGVRAQAQSSGHASAPVAAPAAAGTGAVAVSRKAATTDSVPAAAGQALRFESSWWSADIVRGADGPVVGTVGWFRDFDVEKLVQSSSRAVAEAKAFQTNNFRGSLVSTIGATTLAIGVVVAANGANNAASPILIIGGAGAIGWGLQHINRGYASLSKALWWYNRDSGH
jgi:hypothetical protein